MEGSNGGDDGDDAELIVVRSYADMLARENFVARLNLGGDKLKKVKAEYHFEDEVHCGLTSCNTPHKWGLLVGLESGKETNIGNKCGRNHFPELYDQAHKGFTIRRERRIRADALANFESKYSELRAEISAIWAEDYGARWANECFQVTREASPQCLMDLRSGTLKIVVKKDRDTPNLGFKKTDQFEEKAVGQLLGFSACRETPKTLLDEVTDALDTAQRTTFTSLPAKEQRNLMNRLANNAGKLLRAREQVAAARSFYNRPNLEQLHRVGRNAREGIEAFIKRIEAVPATWARKAG